MSAVCGVCREAKPFVPIEHANDANPTVWAVVPGHQICSDCALDLELDLRPCPFCRISHDKWRPVYNEIAPMDVDETYNGIPELFGSPRQTSPPRPLSPTSERLRARRESANAPPHRESSPAPVRRRGPRPPSGCQFVYANPDTRCKLRGPRRTGSDGKVYCETHIEDGPETAARLLQEQRIKNTLAVTREKSRMEADKRRQAERIAQLEKKAAEAQRRLDLEKQLNTR